jgi:hypothetical protein
MHEPSRWSPSNGPNPTPSPSSLTQEQNRIPNPSQRPSPISLPPSSLVPFPPPPPPPRSRWAPPRSRLAPATPCHADHLPGTPAPWFAYSTSLNHKPSSSNRNPSQLSLLYREQRFPMATAVPLHRVVVTIFGERPKRWQMRPAGLQSPAFTDARVYSTAENNVRAPLAAPSSAGSAPPQARSASSCLPEPDLRITEPDPRPPRALVAPPVPASAPPAHGL